MTADIRTAAQREAVRQNAFHPESPCQDLENAAFAAGAVWGAARVTPTQEQLEVLMVEQFTEADMPWLAESPGKFADAVLALLAGLAEGESSG